MRLPLLLLFIVLPLAEMVLLIKLGAVIGFWPTIGIVVATAILGSTVLHRQGFQVLSRIQEAMAEGHAPVTAVVDGAFLFVAGLALVTPGLITDCIGLLLLIPPVRKAIQRWSWAKFFGEPLPGKTSASRKPPPRTNPGPNTAPRRPRADDIIEAEFEVLDETMVRPDSKPRDPNPH